MFRSPVLPLILTVAVLGSAHTCFWGQEKKAVDKKVTDFRRITVKDIKNAGTVLPDLAKFSETVKKGQPNEVKKLVNGYSIFANVNMESKIAGWTVKKGDVEVPTKMFKLLVQEDDNAPRVLACYVYYPDAMGHLVPIQVPCP